MGEAAVTGDGASRELVTAAEPQGLSYMPELHAYPSPADVSASASQVPSLDHSRWRLTVSPGSIGLSASQDARPTQANVGPRSTTSDRRQISEFSAKSELRMTRRLASLDYTPWSDAIRSGQMLAMVTLTYPGEWEPLAPTSKAAGSHVRAFRARLERAIGPVAGIRKLEIQRRGAPHFTSCCHSQPPSRASQLRSGSRKPGSR